MTAPKVVPFPAVEPMRRTVARGTPSFLDPVAEEVREEERRVRRAGFRLAGAPFRPIERGPEISIGASGCTFAGGSATVATMNPYRPDAFETAVALCHALNSHRELTGALRLVIAASLAFQQKPGVATWHELENASKAAADTLFRVAGR